MRKFALACALLGLAGPAAALSCMAPNFAEAFNRIAAAEEVYSVFYGQLRATETVPPYVEGQPRSVKMQLVGKELGRRGFSDTGTVDVTVETSCSGSWCGPIPATMTQMLVFLEHTEAGLRLTSHACQSDYHVEPSLGQVAAIRACMKDVQCHADEIAAFDLN